MSRSASSGGRIPTTRRTRRAVSRRADAGGATENPPRCFGAHAPHLRRRHLPPHEIRTPNHRDFVGTPGLRALGRVLTNTLPHVLGGSLHLGHLATESLVEVSGRTPGPVDLGPGRVMISLV